MTAPRSFLFVPGDSERKMAKAAAGAAHTLVLDLEDSVAAEKLKGARQTVREFLLARRDRERQQLWVRINPLDTDKALDDLAQVMAGAPDGLLLPKCQGGEDIRRLSHYLSALERREGLSVGQTRVIAVSTETSAAMFGLGSYRDSGGRLAGLTWGAEDLATAVGASTNKSDDGTYSFVFQLARSLCLLGAKAAGVHAIDSVLPNFRDAQALQVEVRRARQDGFTAKFAIHPDQVDVINAGFQPDEREVAHALAVVAAFRQASSAGTLQVDGKMVDKPHLTQALAILEAAGVDLESR